VVILLFSACGACDGCAVGGSTGDQRAVGVCIGGRVVYAVGVSVVYAVLYTVVGIADHETVELIGDQVAEAVLDTDLDADSDGIPDELIVTVTVVVAGAVKEYRGLLDILSDKYILTQS
jgi:hypothetical protein